MRNYQFFFANDVWEAKEGKKGVKAAREGGREGGRRLVPVLVHSDFTPRHAVAA
jgi:hypothetical protein